MFSVFFRKQPKENNEQSGYDNFSGFLSSYRNTIFNQSAHVFSLGYILKTFKKFLDYVTRRNLCDMLVDNCS